MLQFTMNLAGINTKTTEERYIFIVTGALCLKLDQDMRESPLFSRVHCPDLLFSGPQGPLK